MHAQTEDARKRLSTTDEKCEAANAQYEAARKRWSDVYEKEYPVVSAETEAALAEEVNARKGWQEAKVNAETKKGDAAAIAQLEDARKRWSTANKEQHRVYAQVLEVFAQRDRDSDALDIKTEECADARALVDQLNAQLKAAAQQQHDAYTEWGQAHTAFWEAKEEEEAKTATAAAATQGRSPVTSDAEPQIETPAD